MSPAPAAPIPALVQQHAEEAAALRGVRARLVSAPRVGLRDLRRLDERIAAHLDGLAVAGACGWQSCESALGTPGAGEVFAAAVRAIEDRRPDRLDRLLALAEAVPEARPGMISAFGWVSARHLQGTVGPLLSSASAFRRCVGIAACSMHRVDPGPALQAALASDAPDVRARALRAAGELGRRDLLASIDRAADAPPISQAADAADAASISRTADAADAAAVGHAVDAGQPCRFWAAWSAVLLGARGRALDALAQQALTPGPLREPALQLALRALDVGRAHELLKVAARTTTDARTLVRGAGIVGDPRYVPWLILQMRAPGLARAAGESLGMIAGLDLGRCGLDASPPQDASSGPTDRPRDEDVAIDPDEDLPWPDPDKVGAWWQANRQRFQSGVRTFMGEPVTREHCSRVLAHGFQRQRAAAALHRALLDPGRGLFGTRAPAWRQLRWLDQAA